MEARPVVANRETLEQPPERRATVQSKLSVPSLQPPVPANCDAAKWHAASVPASDCELDNAGGLRPNRGFSTHGIVMSYRIRSSGRGANSNRRREARFTAGLRSVSRKDGLLKKREYRGDSSG